MSIAYYLFLPTAPKAGPAFLRFFVVCSLCYFWGWDRGWGGGNEVHCLRSARLSLITPSVLGFTHFMFSWTRLLDLGWHTSCYVGHVFCILVGTLHITLVKSSVLWFAHFMLRWTHPLYFGSDTSVTLDTSSVLLRLTHFMLHWTRTSFQTHHVPVCKLAWGKKKCWRWRNAKLSKKTERFFFRVSNIHFSFPLQQKIDFC